MRNGFFTQIHLNILLWWAFFLKNKFMSAFRKRLAAMK